MNVFHPEIAPAVTGATVTISTAVVGWCAAITPVLQVMTLVASLAVGVLTSIWTFMKIRAALKAKQA